MRVRNDISLTHPDAKPDDPVGISKCTAGLLGVHYFHEKFRHRQRALGHVVSYSKFKFE